nr:OmpH family outer membrane protein [Gammaproteobacteria bacterium]
MILTRTLVLAAGLGVVLSPALAAEVKVGFVDASKVLEQAPQAEDARARLEREFAPRDRTLVSTQKEIRRLEDKVVRDGAIMSDKEKAGVERELRTKRRELKRQQDEFRDDLNLRRNEELQKLQRKVLDTIHALAKRD